MTKPAFDSLLNECSLPDHSHDISRQHSFVCWINPSYSFVFPPERIACEPVEPAHPEETSCFPLRRPKACCPSDRAPPAPLESFDRLESHTEFSKDLNKNTLESCLELFWKMFWLHHTNLQCLFCSNNNIIMLFILVNRIRHRRPWIIKRLYNSSMFSEYVMNFVTDNNF